MLFGWSPGAGRQALLAYHSYANRGFVYRVTVDMRQHCTDGSFRLCRWRAHREALSEDSGPAALSTHGPYVALHVFYAILQHIASELSAHCCRTITMTRYSQSRLWYECRAGAGLRTWCGWRWRGASCHDSPGAVPRAVSIA